MTTQATIQSVLRERRTVHDFESTLPAWPEVEEALQSACFAPNHYFTKPWTFYRIGAHTKAAIVDLNTQLVSQQKGAAAGEKKRQRWSAVPGWLVVTSKVSANSLRHREDYAACCCAVQNLMLDLWSRGIGSKWTTGAVTRDPSFHRLLGIKSHQEEVVALLWYGYPSQVPRALRSPLSKSLKQLP
ncbi:MAG: nitroreductase family protein [Oceanococcus sp.]